MQAESAAPLQAASPTGAAEAAASASSAGAAEAAAVPRWDWLRPNSALAGQTPQLEGHGAAQLLHNILASEPGTAVRPHGVLISAQAPAGMRLLGGAAAAGGATAAAASTLPAGSLLLQRKEGNECSASIHQADGVSRSVVSTCKYRVPIGLPVSWGSWIGATATANPLQMHTERAH